MKTAAYIVILVTLGVVIGAVVYHYRRYRAAARRAELDHAKRVFMSLASHELRTPATAVKNYLSMLEADYGGELNQEQRSYLNAAIAGNERQLRIIEELLHSASLELDFHEAEPQSINLADILNQVVDDHVGAAEARRQKLLLRTPDKLPVIADAVAVRAIVRHLLSNAIKFTPETGRITVKAARERDTVRIEIEDTGVGIKRSDTHRLGEPFTRFDNHLSTSAGGFGLGLYICKKLVRRLGGQIEHQPAGKIGTRVILSLPSAPPNDSVYS